MSDTGHQDAPFGYERKDANLRALLIISLIGVALIIGAIILVDNWFVLVKEDIVYQTVLSPESVALRELRAREDEVLNSYKVLDSTRGIYQIPIDRAMQLEADEAFRGAQGQLP